MQKKDYYALREILLGLRNEYLAHEQKLHELKNNCKIPNENIIDFDFHTVKYSNQDKTILSCEYFLKQNGIQKLIGSIMPKYPNIGVVMSDNNKYYLYTGRQFYPIFSKDEGTDIDMDIKAILNSEFSNVPVTYVNDDSGLLTLGLDSYSIKLLSSNNHTMTYNSKNDVLSYKGLSKPLEKDYIDSTLNLEVNGSVLRDYQIKTIDISEEAKKPIIIEDFAPAKIVDFNIEDNQSHYVLRRINK